LVYERGITMDLLQECARAFERLLPFRYHFTIGRKGKMLKFTLDFDAADFHHLAGLHKLKDNVRFLTGKRVDIFNMILSGKLTYAQAARSSYFSEMESRIPPLVGLESFLDSNKIVFRFNEKVQKFSLVKADYLLENSYKGDDIYLFLSQRTGAETQVCRSFFPKQKLDYTSGQPRYTLLKKEKMDTKTGEITIQYDRLTP